MSADAKNVSGKLINFSQRQLLNHAKCSFFGIDTDLDIALSAHLLKNILLYTYILYH